MSAVRPTLRFILGTLVVGTLAVSPSEAQAKEKKPLVATTLNWFFPGAGYLYNGEKPLYVSLSMLAGAAGLTYIEQVHDYGGGNLKETDSTAFFIMFGSVLTMNTAVAIDAYQEANAINSTTVRYDSTAPTLEPELVEAYSLPMVAPEHPFMPDLGPYGLVQ
jgi:hypothetical protein